MGLSPDNGSACLNFKEIEKEQTFYRKVRIYTQRVIILQELSVCLWGDYSAALSVNTWGDFFLGPYSCFNLYILCKLLLQAATDKRSYCLFYL